MNKDSVELFQRTSGKQMSNPVKSITRIIEAVTHQGLANGVKVPQRLVLGRDAYQRAGELLALLERERQEWKEWSDDAVRNNI